MSTRKELLEAAEQCVCTDRNEQYGEPEDSFKAIADLWNAYLTNRLKTPIKLEAMDAGNMMVLFKMARAATAKVQKDDTYIDMIGYAACAGECEFLEEERKQEAEQAEKVRKETEKKISQSEPIMVPDDLLL
jgi:hypothetical protein